MNTTRLVRACLLSLCAVGTVCAQSTPDQVHTTPQADRGVYSGRLKVDYPTPYEPASVADIRTTLERVHAYLEKATPIQVVNADTGEPVADVSKLPPQISLARTDFQI